MNKIIKVTILILLVKNIFAQIETSTLISPDSIKSIIKEIDLPKEVEIKEIVDLKHQRVSSGGKRVSFGIKYEYYDYFSTILVQVYNNEIKVMNTPYLELKLALKDSIEVITDFSSLKKTLKKNTEILRLKFKNNNSGKFTYNKWRRFNIYCYPFYNKSFSFLPMKMQSLESLNSMINNNEVKLYYILELEEKKSRTMYFLSTSSLKLLYKVSLFY